MSDIEFTVAPTEPPSFRSIATNVNMFPERLGCDVIWFANDLTWGVQRKELRDFLASVGDGRMAREVAQMQHTAMPTLVIEGRIQYDLEGNLSVGEGYGQSFTRAQFRGMLWSVMSEGVNVDYTRDTSDTIEYVKMFSRWSAKTKHSSIMRRPGPVSQWGKPDHEAFAVHMMQGFDGIGLDLARKIVRHYGQLPLMLGVTEESLLEIPGIGKKIVQRLVEGTMRND